MERRMAEKPTTRTDTGRWVRIALGLLIWAVVGVALYGWVHDSGETGRDTRSLEHVKSWMFSQSIPVDLEFDRDVEIRVGDPVLFASAPGSLTQIGDVRALLEGDRTLEVRSGWVRRARCELYLSGHVGLNTTSKVRLVTVPQTAAWIFRTLLPKEKLQRIGLQWNRTLVNHREEIFAAISPVLRRAVRDLQAIVIEGVPEAVALRAPQLARISARLEDSIVKKEFLPLVENDLWPIFMARAQPTLDAIGKEVLERLPVWSFTWRFLYQSLPLTADTYVQNAWRPFVDQQVIPILKEHLDDFFGIFKDVIAAATKNRNVGRAFRRVFDRIIEDVELQHELRMVFQHLILDNPRFHRAMLDLWESPEMTEAIDRLSVFLGPFFAKIGDAVLGTRGGGITPEFARVLRTQILEKDRRFVIIEPGVKGTPLLRWGHRFRAEVSDDE